MLGPTKPEGFADALPEFRLVEGRARRQSLRVQPVWKLYAPGAVGGQTLLGIPRLLALRNHPWLSPHLRIWPFETGLARLDRPAAGSIIAAEVYPSLIEAEPAPVKDAGQVSALARHFGRLDEAEALAALFAGDPALSPEERDIIEREEGWILGVGGKPAAPPRTTSVIASKAKQSSLSGARDGIVAEAPKKKQSRGTGIPARGTNHTGGDAPCHRSFIQVRTSR